MMTKQLDLKNSPVSQGCARYREIETNLLYEVQQFDENFLVRPLGDDFTFMIESISAEEFLERFEESWTIQ